MGVCLVLNMENMEEIVKLKKKKKMRRKRQCSRVISSLEVITTTQAELFQTGRCTNSAHTTLTPKGCIYRPQCGSAHRWGKYQHGWCLWLWINPWKNLSVNSYTIRILTYTSMSCSLETFISCEGISSLSALVTGKCGQTCPCTKPSLDSSVSSSSGGSSLLSKGKSHTRLSALTSSSLSQLIPT